MNPIQPVHWSPGVSLESLERQAIEAAFSFYGKNKTATAQSLGISIRTLDSRLEQYAKLNKEQEQRDQAIRAREQEFLRRSRGGLPRNESIPTRRDDHVNGSDTATEVGKQHQADGAETPTRLHPQPALETPTEQSLSMPEPVKVQELPPQKIAGGSHAKRR